MCCDDDTLPASSSESGYSSAPDPSQYLSPSLIADEEDSSFTNDSLVDSDTSDFFEAPLTQKPVTHKTTKKHNFITKRFKQIGKLIRNGINENMSTLAVL